MDMKDWVTIIAALIAFLGVCITVVANSYYNKKRTFIDVVTKERIKYMQKVRDLLAEFCALAAAPAPDTAKMTEIKYQLLLYLYPDVEAYKEWDKRIIELVKEIIANVSPPNPKLEKLIIISRYNLKIEWDGLRLEAEKGSLSDEQKEANRRKNLIPCKEALEKI